MRTSLAAALTIIIALSTTVATAGDERVYVRPSRVDSDGPAFSAAVRVGDTLYVSGDLGLDDNQQIPADPKTEARLLLDRFSSTLAEAGFSMDDLVYVTVYCSDVTHYADWNAVYRSYFKKEFPARAFVGAGHLLFNARFEMQGIAVRRKE